jgi:hypothetical protein
MKPSTHKMAKLRWAAVGAAGYLLITAAAMAVAQPAPTQSATAVPHDYPMGLRTAAGPVSPAVAAHVQALERLWEKYDADKAAGDSAALAADQSDIFAAYLDFHEQRKAYQKAHQPPAVASEPAPASAPQ